MTGDEVEIAKIIFLGDLGVGKRSIVRLFTGDFFEYIETMGVEFKFKTLNIEGGPIKLQIILDAALERFRIVPKSFYRGYHGVFFIFDVSRRDTFDFVKKRIEEFFQYHSYPDIEILLIGNKCDLEKQVTKEEATDFAKGYNIPYFETSVKDKINIDEVFYFFAKKYREKMLSAKRKNVVSEKKKCYRQKEKTADTVKDLKHESGSTKSKNGCNIS